MWFMGGGVWWAACLPCTEKDGFDSLTVHLFLLLMDLIGFDA